MATKVPLIGTTRLLNSRLSTSSARDDPGETDHREERELIRKRCEEGIERAKRKGTQFGRPNRLDAGEKRKIAELYAAGRTIPELAEEYECGVGTIWRALNPFEVSASP